ncbi:unnamed protein product, partial [Rotaria socialis]
KKRRQNSTNFGNQNNPIPRKPGRPKRNQTDFLQTTNHCQTPQSTLSDGSLDALLDSSTNIDQPMTQTSPIVLRRTTRQSSTSNTTINHKRSSDNDEHLQNSRKFPKLLTQALKDDFKIGCQDISPTQTITATKLLNQSSQIMIKTEPEQYDHTMPFDKNSPLSQSQACRSMPINNANSSMGNSQSTLLRTLIRTPQNSSIITKKDAPLYDLLEHLETTTPNDNSLFSGQSSLNNSIDPFEQYLTPVMSQNSMGSNNHNNNSSKDDYLAALLNTDPKQPNELSFIPTNKQQQQQ